MGFGLYMSGMPACIAILVEVPVSGTCLFGMHMGAICIFWWMGGCVVYGNYVR